jgi:glyoxylase I family protein
MSIQRLSHIGLCVSDLQRSAAFYCEGLGFTRAGELKVRGESSETLVEIPGGAIEAVYLERDGTRIELLYYPEAGSEKISAPRPMNRVGLSHLSLRVSDIDVVLADLEKLGGRCLQQTRVDNDDWGTRVVFVTDPDGTRIELLQAPGDPNSLPGA